MKKLILIAAVMMVSPNLMADKVCNPAKSKPCGNACIQKEYNCTKQPGTARWPKDRSELKASPVDYDKLYGQPPKI